MRLHRFFITQPLGEELVITNKELLKQWFLVFRYTIGDFVILFSHNEGFDYTYTIVSHYKTSTTLRRLEKQPEKNILPKKNVTLCISLIKKDNLELIVQKGTELGVSSFIFFVSSRSEKKNVDIERLVRIAKEATEQSGRGYIPEIKEASSLLEALEVQHDGVSYGLDMQGTPIFSVTNKEFSFPHAHIALFIGPEGGWDETERDIFLRKQIPQIKLTETTLRSETAALVAAFSFLQEMN